jgi:hypothetical protein
LFWKMNVDISAPPSSTSVRASSFACTASLAAGGMTPAWASGEVATQVVVTSMMPNSRAATTPMCGTVRRIADR